MAILNDSKKESQPGIGGKSTCLERGSRRTGDDKILSDIARAVVGLLQKNWAVPNVGKCRNSRSWSLCKPISEGCQF